MKKTMGMRARLLLLLLGMACFLLGCGGGDGVGSGGTGVFKSAVAVGSVSDSPDMGHVVVNGVRFDVSNAQMEIEDSGAGLLKPGMTVQISGTVDPGLNTGTATYVLSIPELRGTVDEVQEPQGRFSVMGVQVSVDKTTIFDGVSALSALQSGQRVQIYALPEGEGDALRATRVETLTVAPGAVRPVLRGAVEDLNVTARQFRVGTMVIHYGSAAFVDGLDAAALTNGTLLYISAAQAPVGQILEASQLRPAHGLPPQADSPVTLAGLVAEFTSLQSFVLQTTRIDASRAKITGGSASDVGPGAKLTVAGNMAAGVLMAERVEIIQAASPAANPDSSASPGSGGHGNSNAGGNGNLDNGGSNNGNSGSGGTNNGGSNSGNSGNGGANNGGSNSGNSGNGGANNGGSNSGNSGSGGANNGGSNSGNSGNGGANNGGSNSGNSGSGGANNGGSNNGSSDNGGTNNGGSNNGNSGSGGANNGGTNNGGSNNGNSGNGGTNNGGSNNGNSGNGGTNNGGSNNGNSGNSGSNNGGSNNAGGNGTSNGGGKGNQTK